MGTDNIHHKKKAKSFERKNPKKLPGKRYLIVCEGEKTEPFYFRELRYSLRLKTTIVEVCGKECGSDPVSVFEYAERLANEDKYSPYDGVYCVIDSDDHKNLRKALDLIEKKGSPFTRILSYPCFEYWLLLHHVLHRTAFNKTGKKSVGEVVESELRKFDKNYVKAEPGVWARYESSLPTAIANAEIIQKAAARSGNQNPHTEIHELVKLLIGFDS